VLLGESGNRLKLNYPYKSSIYGGNCACENTWAYSPGEILPEKALKPFPYFTAFLLQYVMAAEKRGYTTIPARWALS
jgi:hypothetical protein